MPKVYNFKLHINRLRLEKVITENILCHGLKRFPSEYKFIFPTETFMKVFFLKY